MERFRNRPNLFQSLGWWKSGPLGPRWLKPTMSGADAGLKASSSTKPILVVRKIWRIKLCQLYFRQARHRLNPGKLKLREGILIGPQDIALHREIGEFAFTNDLDKARGFQFFNMVG